MKTPDPGLIIECLDGLGHRPPTVWVGFSGGLDSTVLLDLALRSRELAPWLNIRGLHVNHQLQAHSGAFAEHCRLFCVQREVGLDLIRVEAEPKHGQSPEEAARIARLDAFESLTKRGDVVLFAHHQDDQAETLLLQLLRGAGLEGLSGMPLRSKIGAADLLRPLLGHDRSAILEYALKRNLLWIEDPSNLSLAYARNFLRAEILPRLKQRWPSMSRTFSRSAHLIQIAAERQKKAQESLVQRTSEGPLLDLPKLRILDPEEQALAVRGWFRTNGLRMPSIKVLDEFLHAFLACEKERSPRIELEDGRIIERFQDIAHILTVKGQPTPCRWYWGNETIRLPDHNGTISCKGFHGPLAPAAIWETGRVEIRYRQGGERIRLEGESIHRELRDLFQSHQIPPWIRSRIPLVYHFDQSPPKLISIGGLWYNDDHSELLSGGALKFSWHPPEGLDPRGTLLKMTISDS